MNTIGVMSKVADDTIGVTFENQHKQTYTFSSATLEILEDDILYPVHFVGFSQNHFIMVYTRPDMSDPTYIATGEFKSDFMKEFIEILSK